MEDRKENKKFKKIILMQDSMHVLFSCFSPLFHVSRPFNAICSISISSLYSLVFVVSLAASASRQTAVAT